MKNENVAKVSEKVDIFFQGLLLRLGAYQYKKEHVPLIYLNINYLNVWKLLNNF